MEIQIGLLPNPLKSIEISRETTVEEALSKAGINKEEVQELYVDGELVKLTDTLQAGATVIAANSIQVGTFDNIVNKILPKKEVL